MLQENRKIGIDLDETLASTFGPIFESARTKYGWTKGFHEMVRVHDWWSLPELGITKDEAFKIFDEYFEKDASDSTIEAIEGTKEGVARLLSDGYEIHVVTARAESVRGKSTYAWLARHFPQIPQHRVHFTNHYQSEVPVTKGEVCRNLGISVLIDDNMDFLETASRIDIHGILVNRPWNEDLVLPKNIQRILHWNEIPDLIQALPYGK